jgi:hypothetical protein
MIAIIFIFGIVTLMLSLIDFHADHGIIEQISEVNSATMGTITVVSIQYLVMDKLRVVFS